MKKLFYILYLVAITRELKAADQHELPAPLPRSQRSIFAELFHAATDAAATEKKASIVTEEPKKDVKKDKSGKEIAE